MEIFRQILSLLHESFPENWLDDRAEDFNEALPNRISEFINEVFDLFCESLISGEYVKSSHDDSIATIEELIDFLNTNFDDLAGDAEFQQLVNENIKERLVAFVKIIALVYKDFLGHYSTLSTYPFVDITFSINFEIDFNDDFNNDEELNEKRSLFIKYLEIQFIDHFFSDSPHVFRRLSYLNHSLIKDTCPSWLKARVIEKANFLKHKWILRRYHYSLDEDSNYPKGYISSGKVKEFFDEEEFTATDELLKNWSTHLDDHYGLSKSSESKIRKRAIEIKTKEFDDLSLSEIHCLIKHYKDITKDQRGLRSICKYLSKKLDSNNSNLYSSQVWKKAIIYAYNNYYSLLLKLDERAKAQKIRDKIEHFQDLFNITNFFADKKHIEYELNDIQEAFENRELSNHLQNENERLEKLSKVIDRCEQRLAWAFQHHNLLYQLEYSESLIPTQKAGFPGVFYASTFMLPIPQITNMREFDELKKKYDSLRVISSSLSSLKLEFQELKKNSEELKNNDFRSIEIIGIFTAIVTVVFSSIASFNFLDSFQKAFFFFVVISSSLLLSVLLIILVKRGRDLLIRNSILFLLIIIVIISSLLFYLNTPHQL